MNKKNTSLDGFSADVQKPTDYNIAINLLSGAMAGGIAKTCIAPLDLAKINFQIQ